MSKTLTDRKQDQAVVVELRFIFLVNALLVQSGGQNETCSFSGLRIWQSNGRSNGAEFKYMDAPKRTRSMHQAIEDLSLAHLYVIYPGSRQYALSERITVLPVQGLGGCRAASWCGGEISHAPVNKQMAYRSVRPERIALTISAFTWC